MVLQWNTTAAAATLGEADLAIVKTAPGAMIAGTQATWEIQVSNNGPAAAVGVIVTDPLPADASFVFATGATCTAPGSEVTCTLGMIPAGEAAVVDVTALMSGTIPPGTPLTQEARVTAENPDPDLANNSSEVTKTVTIPMVNPFAAAVFSLLGAGVYLIHRGRRRGAS